MNDELKTVKGKIAKLIALGTSENTLSEAGAAMAKAQKLMEEWSLSIDDIELGDDDIVHEVIDTGRRQRPDLSGILSSLSKFMCVKLWVSTPSKYYKADTYKINLLGYETDIELFKYFWSILNTTVDSEYRKYRKSPERPRGVHGKRLRTSFVYGFTSSVNETLWDLVEENEHFVTKSGTELVPLKSGKIEDYFAEEFGLRLRKTGSGRRITTSHGISAGNTAGSSVSFSRPVGGSSGGTKLIGAL